jgi:uncharacterized protein (TIGR02466 family)
MRNYRVQQPKTGPLNIFLPYIWKYNYDFNRAELTPKLDNLFSLVKENSQLESGNALSTVSLPSHLQPHTWPELREFQHWLGDKIDYLRAVNKFIINHSEVSNSWANKHGPGGVTLEHSHSNVTFVVACYLWCPPQSGNIEFKDPLEYHKSGWPIIPEESLYAEVPVETNDVLIFPGWVKHRVQPNLSTQDRYVLTFNIK